MDKESEHIKFDFVDIDKRIIITRVIDIANEIIEAKQPQPLSLNDQKILYLTLALQSLCDENQNECILAVPKNLILDTIGDDGSNYYLIRKALDSLLKRNSISFITNDGTIINYNWLSYAEYKPNADFVYLKINPDLLKYLFHLKTNYTQLPIGYTFNFRTKYSPKLYSMLCRFTDTGWRQDTLKDIREKLGIESNEYKRVNDFEKRVLQPAIKDINEVSNIYVSYEKKRYSNKVLFKFIIEKKSQLDSNLLSQQYSGLHKMQEKQGDKLSRDRNCLDELEKLFKEVFYKHLIEKGIKNPVGLYKKMTAKDIEDEISLALRDIEIPPEAKKMKNLKLRFAYVFNFDKRDIILELIKECAAKKDSGDRNGK